MASKVMVRDWREEEDIHFASVLSIFRSYRSCMDEKFRRRIMNINSLPLSQQNLLMSYKKSLFEIRKCIIQNQDLIDLIIKDAGCMFSDTNHSDLGINYPAENHSNVEINRVQVTLIQLVRDWSAYGASEREACYGPIIKEITSNFPTTERDPEGVKVLVPGSGLGRLAYEIASLGYTCQGNEFSLFMLIASFFVINKSTGINAYQMFPWVGQVDNNMTTDHQTHCVKFPDVYPATLLKQFPSRFSMAAGDFLEIYKTPNEWDCVATCFFIDCAHNILDFMEQIYKILKPGGIWVNLGPLKYHFSNVPHEFSIEPQYSILREIITGLGFKREKEQVNMRTTYCQNLESMSYHEYRSLFFVYRKPVE